VLTAPTHLLPTFRLAQGPFRDCGPAYQNNYSLRLRICVGDFILI
jgi:hypothetical protein